MRRVVAALVRFNTLVVMVVKMMVGVMAVGMVAAILWQVCMRYVFLRPPSWTEELALLLFSWSMLLMLAVGVRELFHVKVNLAEAVLPAGVNKGLQALIDVLVAGFGGYLLWAGILYCNDMSGSRSAAIGYPIVLLYGVAPVCGGLVLLFSLERLLQRLTGMTPSAGVALHEQAGRGEQAAFEEPENDEARSRRAPAGMTGQTGRAMEGHA